MKAINRALGGRDRAEVMSGRAGAKKGPRPAKRAVTGRWLSRRKGEQVLDSEDFINDIDYLANYYSWDADDLADVMAQTVANPDEMGRYWTRLAAAHRAGYAQTLENNFMRLGQWLHRQGPDPDKA